MSRRADDKLMRRVRRSVGGCIEAFDGVDSLCVIVPDATRPIAHRAVLEELFDSLYDRVDRIDVVVALGLHRPMNDRELRGVEDVCEHFGIDLTQHDARGGELVELELHGPLPSSAPDVLEPAVNRRVVDADAVICVGTVEPHQYAGFSGGIKAISIGCGSAETISAMHGLSLLRHSATALGSIDDNPFQQTLWSIAGELDDIWGLQIVPGERAVFFDRIRPAFQSACEVASEAFFRPVDDSVRWLHLPVPAEKATNFYQASRAATYVAVVDRPAVEPGGVILVEAECPEGIGTGSGERACAEAMGRGRNALLDELRGGAEIEIRGGQQRAYVLAKALDRNEIAVVGAEPMVELESMGIEQFDAVDEAVAYYGLEHDPGLRVDDVFRGVPVKC